jgi:hypothetical protein
MTQCPNLAEGLVLSICAYPFGFVSDFGFRVSDLEDDLSGVLFSVGPVS